MSRIAGVLALSFSVVVVSCQKSDASKDASAPPATPGATPIVLGIAEIKDSTGKILGTASFSQTDAGISVKGRIVGLAPGEYGMHLHTVGLCEAPEFASSGGHWNPTGKMHGVSNPAGAHEGDLPNLLVLPDSVGQVQGVTMGGIFKSDSTGLMDKDGAAIVIHAKPDDYKTDPSGNAGARMACGVIVAKP